MASTGLTLAARSAGKKPPMRPMIPASTRDRTMMAGVGSKVNTISDHVLSKRLKELERAGIVARTVTPSTPVCITYSLTERGAELAVVMSKRSVYPT